MCRCGGHLLSPDCYGSLDAISVGAGGHVEFVVSAKHNRMQLLENIYGGSTVWGRHKAMPLADAQRRRRSAAPTTIADNTTLASPAADPHKMISLMFRTRRSDGLLLFAATNKHYTMVQLSGGRIQYQSMLTTSVNMTVNGLPTLADGHWHNVTLLLAHGRGVLHVLIDGQRCGDELDSAGVHDFLDPYLTVLALGGVRHELWPTSTTTSAPTPFEGCLANFTVGAEVQPFNGTGSIFSQVLSRGQVYQGCHGVAIGIDAAQMADPLSIGITLVIVFFVILLVAILVSFVVFRLRKQHKEKSGIGLGGGVGGGGSGSGVGGGNGLHHGNGAASAMSLHAVKQQNSIGGGQSTILGSGAAGGMGGQNDGGGLLVGRGMMMNDAVGFHVDGDLIRGIGGGHHLVGGPELLLSKKYKERNLGGGGGGNDSSPQQSLQLQQRPQRPDIIEREVIGMQKPMRGDELHPMSSMGAGGQPPPSLGQSHHLHDHPGGGDMHDYPEHYDLENASSIAPSDIDIVYHYKGYRDGGGGPRKYKAQPPPSIASYTHHKHAVAASAAQHQQQQHQREQQLHQQQHQKQQQQHQQQQQQHRHSPHHIGPFAPRQPPHAPPAAPTSASGSSSSSSGVNGQPPLPPLPLPPQSGGGGGVGGGGGGVGSGGRPHQSTPLARLSPSSELSSQQPRILTLHDISGKPLQSALLATTSSSGGVGGGGGGKDAMHSNSERSLNSPVMSQLSGQGSSASRTKPMSKVMGGGGVGGGGGGGGRVDGNNVGGSSAQQNQQIIGPGGVVNGGGLLTAEEIHRLNARQRSSSLVSTLDAVSSSSEAPRGSGGLNGVHHHMGGHHHRGGGGGGGHHHSSSAVDAHSATTTDESGNDSFTCSEIEYDNNSLTDGVGGDDDDDRNNKYAKNGGVGLSVGVANRMAAVQAHQRRHHVRGGGGNNVNDDDDDDDVDGDENDDDDGDENDDHDGGVGGVDDVDGVGLRSGQRGDVVDGIGQQQQQSNGVGSGGRRNNNINSSASKSPLSAQMPPAYGDSFDSVSYRGSLSTLAASDDEELSNGQHHHHMAGMYRAGLPMPSAPPNPAAGGVASGGGATSAATTLGWDYLLNWGPNFESLMGVYKDMAGGELADRGGLINGGGPVNGNSSANGGGAGVAPPMRMQSTNGPKPSEEYV